MLNLAQMKRNNLDNLFKEKFKDFSEIPDERIWEKLEASLAKKKKKRVVPIWWQLGGAAAAIAILLYIIDPFSSVENTAAPTIVDTEEHIQDSPQNTEDKNLDNLKPIQQSRETPLVDSERSTGDGIKAKEHNTISPASKNIVHPQRDRSIPSEAIAVNTQEKGEQENRDKLADLNKDKDPIAVKNGDVAENHRTPKDPNETIKNGENENKLDLLEGETEVAQNENEEEKPKISIYEAIEAQEESEQEAVAVSQKKDRWSMGPSVAPVFFSSTGEGSPVHSDFAPNSKSGNLNLSYGLTVTYNISEKLSVRSGVHRVDFGYDTNDVLFSSSLTTSSNELIDNISYTQTSRNLVLESKSSRSATIGNDVEFTGGGASELEGQMVQQLGYIEVPMELNYALVDRRFGINLIGGVSSLFLVDNSISVESDQLVAEVGEANNANSVNFSTNIGIGFNYEISKKVQFNVEPIFKYQLNTFSDTAGDFRPFAIGVYSGLNFRF